MNADLHDRTGPESAVADVTPIPDEALSGEVTADVRAFVGAAAACLALRWWGERDGTAVDELARRACLQLAAFRGRAGSQRLDAAVGPSTHPGHADSVLDPLAAWIEPVLRRQEWGDERASVFVRCFLLEILLVEAFRLERASPKLGEGATGALYEFIRSKARPHVRGRLQAADADDTLAEITSGLLAIESRGWKRKSLLEFRRSESSLAAFVVTSTRYHVLDVLARLGGVQSEETELNENADLDPHAGAEGVGGTVAAAIEPIAAPGGSGAGAEMPDIADALRAVLGSGRTAPKVLDPATPAGRKRLALVEACLHGQLADERHGALTCNDGTAQQKFVLVQGLPPCIAVGNLGGDWPHPRFDDPGLSTGGDRGGVVERGFEPGSCRTYSPSSDGQDEEWLHWRLLYTMAFFSTASRAGLLPHSGPAFSSSACPPHEPPMLSRDGMRQWCVRKKKDEPVPGDQDLDRVLASYRTWILQDRDAIAFAAESLNGTIRAQHAYPHVLLSSYAFNAFCSLFAGYRLGVPLAIDDLRSAFKDLRTALQAKGGRREGRR